MTALPTILDQVYPTIAVQISPTARRFLEHLATIAGCTPSTLAEQYLNAALELEAEQLMQILSGPDFTGPAAAAAAAPQAEPKLTVAMPTTDFLTYDEAEEAAREKMLGIENPE